LCEGWLAGIGVGAEAEAIDWKPAKLAVGVTLAVASSRSGLGNCTLTDAASAVDPSSFVDLLSSIGQ
jgi:hypothetical protein